MQIIGYHRPPRAFAELDDKYLSLFTPRVNVLDLPRRPNALRKLHHEWRQRALKEQHFFRVLDTAQYHGALLRLMMLGWEVHDDPDFDSIIEAPVVPPEAPELRPPPRLSRGYARLKRCRTAAFKTYPCSCSVPSGTMGVVDGGGGLEDVEAVGAAFER